MSASIVYCIESGTNEICVDVYNDGVKILDEYVTYPFTNAPTADLQQCLEQYKTLIDASANELIAMGHHEYLIYKLRDIDELVARHNRLLVLLKERPDYTL